MASNSHSQKLTTESQVNNPAGWPGGQRGYHVINKQVAVTVIEWDFHEKQEGYGLILSIEYL